MAHNHYLTLADDGMENESTCLKVADISYDSHSDVKIYGENVVFDGVNTV